MSGECPDALVNGRKGFFDALMCGSRMRGAGEHCRCRLLTQKLASHLSSSVILLRVRHAPTVKAKSPSAIQIMRDWGDKNYLI